MTKSGRIKYSVPIRALCGEKKSNHGEHREKKLCTFCGEKNLTTENTEIHGEKEE